MVEIYGYIVTNGGEPEKFYKSHYNFIDFGGDNDTEATVSRSYVFTSKSRQREVRHHGQPGGRGYRYPRPDKAAPEETVTISVEPESGYELGGVTVTAAARSWRSPGLGTANTASRCPSPPSR